MLDAAVLRYPDHTEASCLRGLDPAGEIKRPGRFDARFVVQNGIRRRMYERSKTANQRIHRCRADVFVIEQAIQI